MNKSRRNVLFISILSIVIVVVLLSFNTGIWDWVEKTITGRQVTSQPSNVSITVTGISPVTVSILNSTLIGANVDPAENTLKAVLFNLHVYDSDGVNDINDSSYSANFTKGGEALRSNSSCSLVADINTTTANVSCTIFMWYFDALGEWNISAQATDLGNKTFIGDGVNNRTFQFNQLQAIVISPNALSFPAVAPGALNQTSDNDPTLINNTGNYDVTSGNVRVNAITLVGETVSTEHINASNFTIDIYTGGTPPASCNGTKMINGSIIGITNSLLTHGNHTPNFGNESSGQEELYYCLVEVPTDISSQVFSTLAGGSWTISIA